MAAKEIEFIKGVNMLHAFYTENVRMLAHAYDLTDEEASRVLAHFDFKNVSRAILRDPRVDVLGGITGEDKPGEAAPDSGPDGSGPEGSAD